MKEEGVDLSVIGLMALVGLPYTVKFLWAPFLDRYRLPFLGRRRGWLLVTQVALALALAALGMTRPASHPWMVAAAAFWVTFFSATQDIVVDAYRREDLTDNELGLGSSFYINGYRVGMLLASGGGLIMADFMPFSSGVSGHGMLHASRHPDDAFLAGAAGDRSVPEEPSRRGPGPPDRILQPEERHLDPRLCSLLQDRGHHGPGHDHALLSGYGVYQNGDRHGGQALRLLGDGRRRFCRRRHHAAPGHQPIPVDLRVFPDGVDPGDLWSWRGWDTACRPFQGSSSSKT